MKWFLPALFIAALPVWGQEADPPGQPRMIDATGLTVQELMALALAEREAGAAHSCCDWGGLGCRAETMSAARSEMRRAER
ncbi:MAG: hypothetical protein HKO05_11025 [Erythrobacter sp.]|nr:hypothetical protein [Erythrobacter sp.]RZV98731.1 MAG: hypothetical protein EX266_16515 [Paracoccaceae bacterium]